MQPKTRGARKQEAALEAGKFCGVAAAVIGSAVVGGVVASKGAKAQANATTTANQANIDANKLDPHITSMLYGSNGGGGILDEYKKLGQVPQLGGINTYGRANDNYLGYQATQDTNKLRETALQQMQGGILTPAVQAPSQNDINLRPAFERFINGAPGANPFLTKMIGSGIDMSKAAYKQQQDDSTKNLMENILPSIRSGAVMAGGYGGSRQGVAEGNAIGQFQKEQERSLTNFGLGNTNSAVGAQSQAYDTDSNRALAAAQGLSAQQYGVAQANAQAAMQTNQLNATQKQAGETALSGVLSNAYNTGVNQDNYDINRAGQVNTLLQPYLSKNPVPINSQPVFSNTASSALGGAMAGVGLYNQFKGLGGTSTPPPSWNTITSGYQSGTGY